MQTVSFILAPVCRAGLPRWVAALRSQQARNRLAMNSKQARNKWWATDHGRRHSREKPALAKAGEGIDPLTSAYYPTLPLSRRVLSGDADRHSHARGNPYLVRPAPNCHRERSEAIPTWSAPRKQGIGEWGDRTGTAQLAIQACMDVGGYVIGQLGLNAFYPPKHHLDSKEYVRANLPTDDWLLISLDLARLDVHDGAWYTGFKNPRRNRG